MSLYFIVFSNYNLYGGEIIGYYWRKNKENQKE